MTATEPSWNGEAGRSPQVLVTVAGTGLLCSCDAEPELAIPFAARLRRMDRYGRYGFLAGALALADAAWQAPERPDPRAGVVFGSCWGCRDSITAHDALVRARGELSPAVFAQTVHNSVNGELAIAFRLGGVSEAVVSGAAAGLEAVALAWRRVRDGAADLVVTGAAEGVREEMVASERLRGRPAPEEAGAALVLARGGPGSAISGAIQLFEPDPSRVSERLRGFAAGADLQLVEPDPRASTGAVALLVRAAREGRAAVIAARDVLGSLVAVRLTAPRSAGSDTTGSGGAGSGSPGR